MKENKNLGKFNRKENKFLYDNPDDETVMNILNLYPERESFFFMGPDGEKKRAHLQKKLRAILNEMQEGVEYENALGDNLRRGFRRLGKKAKEKLQQVGQLVARAALSAPRGAALALIRLNYRGIAKRWSLLSDQDRQKVADKWVRLGGKTDRLNDAIKAGKDKPLIVCGKKCRAKAGRNPQISAAVNDNFVNAVETATVTALIGTGGGIISALLIAGGKKADRKHEEEMKKLDAELAKKDKEQAAIDATMTPQERALADEIIKAQNAAGDAAKAIANNPNLTALEKEAALNELAESNTFFNSNKKIIGGVLIALGILGVAYFALSNKNSNS